MPTKSYSIAAVLLLASTSFLTGAAVPIGLDPPVHLPTEISINSTNTSATTAATATRQTMADPRGVLIAESKAGWPSGSATAVLAVTDPTYAPALGAATALARSQNIPLLVVDRTAGNASVVGELKRLGTTKVILVGAAWSPKEAVRQEINAAVANQEWISAPGSKEIAAAVAAKFGSSPNEAYMAPVSSVGDVAIASAASAFQKSPLLLVDSAIDSNQLAEIKRLGIKTILMVGKSPLDEASATALTNANVAIGEITGTTVAQRSEAVLDALQNRNVNTRVVSIASETRPMDGLLSAALSARAGSIPIFAAKSSSPVGKVRELVGGWASETQKVTVLGPESDLPASYVSGLTAIASAPRTQPGALHVSGVTTNAQGVNVVSFTAFTGASRYKVVDLLGAVVYDNTALKFEAPAGEGTFLLQALNAQGGVLAQRDLRLTEDDPNTAVVDRITISSETNKAHISWSEAASKPRPRMVVRSEMGINPESGSISLINKTVIAITCGSTYTDSQRPVGKEIIYEVTQFGTTAGNICTSTGPSPSVRAAEENMTSARTPSMAASSAMEAKSGAQKVTAIPTTSEQALMAATNQMVASAASSTDSVAAAATLPWKFRYQTFIQPDRVRPFFFNRQVFSGDNRNYAAAWSDRYRTRVDLTYTFASPRTISRVDSSISIGETTEYMCSTDNLYNCGSAVRKRTQTTDGITVTGSNNVKTVNHRSGIPFGVLGAFGAPAPVIDYNLRIVYGAGGFTVVGSHDGAPAHELWGGWVPGEWIEYYSQGEVCGFALGLSGFCNQSIVVKV